MSKKNRKPRNTERELSLIGHLEELRMRLFICVVAFFAFTFISFLFASPVLEILIKPVTSSFSPPVRHGDAGTTNTLNLVVEREGLLRVAAPESLQRAGKLEVLNLVVPPSEDAPTTRVLTLISPPPKQNKIVYPSPLDPFMMLFKVALVMGILFSLVVWAWQIWLFVAPGLTEKEKGVVRPLLVGAIFLFPLGSCFAYFMIFMIVRVMQRYIVPGIDILYNVSNYLKLMTTMMIVFGIIFELPLVVAMLSRVGIVTPAFLRHYRRHIYVGMAFAAMVITPTTDPVSMIIAMAPLVLLFEVSVLISVPMALMRARAEAEDEAEEASPP